MQSVLNKIGRLLVSFDIFGIPNSLILGRSIIYKSKFSGFVSIWMVLFLIIFALIQIIKLYLMEEVSIQNLLMQNGFQDPIIFNEINLPPAIHIEYNDQSQQQTYFQVKLEYISWNDEVIISQLMKVRLFLLVYAPKHKQQTQYLLIHRHKVPIKQQKILKIGIVHNQRKTTQYKETGDNKVFLIKYVFIEFNYIKYSILYCFENDKDNQNQFTKKCGNQSNFLSDSDKIQSIKISLLYLNFQQTPEDAKTPIKPYIDSDVFFEFNPNNQFLQCDLYYRKYIVNTYNDFLNDNNFNKEIYIVRDFLDYRQQLINKNFHDIPSNKQSIAEIFIRRSRYTHESFRRFPSISSILSLIGGLISFYLAMGTIIMGQYNEQSYLKTLVNTTYSFAEEDEFDKAIDQTKKLGRLENDLNSNIVIYNQANIIVQITNKLKIATRYSISFICRCVDSLKVHRKIYSIGMEMIYRDFNILRIINALHDIERIKQLIMTEDQLELFNYLPKPIVVLKREKEFRKQLDFQEIPINVNQINNWAEIHPTIFHSMFERLADFSKNYIQKEVKEKQIELFKLKKLYLALQKQQFVTNFENDFQYLLQKQLRTLIDRNTLFIFQPTQYLNEEQLFKKIENQRLTKRMISLDKLRQESQYKQDQEIAKKKSFDKDTFFQQQTNKQRKELKQHRKKKIATILSGDGQLYKNEYFEIEYQKIGFENRQYMNLLIIIHSKYKFQIESLQYKNDVIKGKLEGNQISIECKNFSIKQKLKDLSLNSDHHIYLQIEEIQSIIQENELEINFKVLIEDQIFHVHTTFYQIKEQIFLTQNYFKDQFQVYNQLLTQKFQSLTILYQINEISFIDIQITKNINQIIDIILSDYTLFKQNQSINQQILFFISIIDQLFESSTIIIKDTEVQNYDLYYNL